MSYTDPTKALISIRYFLQGKEYHKAAWALNFASKLHTGKRKDGVTPEFHHQVSMALYARTLPISPDIFQAVLASIFLHDTREDYGTSLKEIEVACGTDVALAVSALSKIEENKKKSMPDYFATIGSNKIASIVKGVDRINNVQTMVGVFTKEKQIQYIEETNAFVIPMIKEARRLFPEHEPVYENIKYVLRNQLSLIQKIIDASN